MTEIEKTKKEIEVLTAKLALLEELEKTKSPVEEAYKKVYGVYPTNEITYNSMWSVFKKGYYSAQEDYKVGKFQEPEEQVSFVPKEIKELVKEGVKWCEEHPNESVKDYLTPKTPEETEQSLKEAFREAIKQGVVSSVDNPTDDFMDKMVAELKGQTLTDIIWNWWGNVFTSNEDWDAENAIEHLVDLIEEFLPKSQNSDGSQNAYVESAVEGYNDCIRQIKSRLR